MEIITDFFNIRLAYYAKRKEYYLKFLASELKTLKNKIKFIKLVISKKLIVSNRKRVDLIADLKGHGLDQMNTDIDTQLEGYGYLIKMPIYNLTKEKITDFVNMFKSQKQEYDTLKKKTDKQLWLEDLDRFTTAYSGFMDNYKQKYSV